MKFKILRYQTHYGLYSCESEDSEIKLLDLHVDASFPEFEKENPEYIEYSNGKIVDSRYNEIMKSIIGRNIEVAKLMKFNHVCEIAF